MDAVADLMNALCPAVAQLACVIESTSGSPLLRVISLAKLEDAAVLAALTLIVDARVGEN